MEDSDRGTISASEDIVKFNDSRLNTSANRCENEGCFSRCKYTLISLGRLEVYDNMAACSVASLDF